MSPDSWLDYEQNVKNITGSEVVIPIECLDISNVNCTKEIRKGACNIAVVTFFEARIARSGK